MAQSGVPSKKTAFDAYWTNQIVAIQALTDHQIEMATIPHNTTDSPGNVLQVWSVYQYVP